MSDAIVFHTRNITKFFRSIDPDVIAEGREWYPRARAFAEELAEEYSGVSREYTASWNRQVERAAAVIAVLSPQVNWERNKLLARKVYALAYSSAWHYRLSIDEVRRAWKDGLTDGPTKAFRILVMGEEPNDVVKGPKVRQFWFTIVDPTDPRAVVVDRHAWAVAAGRVLTDAELGQYSGRLGAYDAVSEMYRRAAKILSREGVTFPGEARQLHQWTPAEVQAITWTAWRREHAHTAKANRKTELGE
jgi:hypothetical protein